MRLFVGWSLCGKMIQWEVPMKALLRGVVHGKTIELPEETGLPEGQEVTIFIEPVGPRLLPGEGLTRSAGAWAADSDELDEYLEWNRRQRKAGRRGLES
jgi:hypothetical protein